jgi:hypothetical protein
MPERPASSTTPEPGEPQLRAGTWQPRPRPRHARAGSEPADDPLRLAAEELPWGIPARAAGRGADELPPAIVVATHRRPAPALVAGGAALVMLLLVVLLLALVR